MWHFFASVSVWCSYEISAKYAIANEKIREAASDAEDGWKIWKKLHIEQKQKILGKR